MFVKHSEINPIIKDYVETHDDFLDTRELVANKTTAINDSSTNTQYPSAKAVVDYVKDNTSTIYNFMGSAYMDSDNAQNLPSAADAGKGAVYNISHGSGTITLNEVFSATVQIIDMVNFTINMALPVETLVEFNIIDEETMHTYTTTDIIQVSYNNNTGLYTYTTLDQMFEYEDIGKYKAAAGVRYTLSFSPGDNVVSNGVYWDNLGSTVNLSGYATTDMLNEKTSESDVQNILAGQVNLGYVNINQNGQLHTPNIYLGSKNPNWSGLIQYDSNGSMTTMEQTLAAMATKQDLIDLENNIKAYINEIFLGGEW